MKNNKKCNNLVDLQLALIRIYIGLDFIHHFAEKFGLLGIHEQNEVANYFHSIGLSFSIMILGGLCEFGAFVGFTFGLFTRLASVGTAFYLIISLIVGHHYQAGFTWADHASDIMINHTPETVYGGWEYPALWAFICLSFVLTGGRKWSIDALIRKHLPSTRYKFLSFLVK